MSTKKTNQEKEAESRAAINTETETKKKDSSEFPEKSPAVEYMEKNFSNEEAVDYAIRNNQV